MIQIYPNHPFIGHYPLNFWFSKKKQWRGHLLVTEPSMPGVVKASGRALASAAFASGALGPCLHSKAKCWINYLLGVPYFQTYYSIVYIYIYPSNTQNQSSWVATTTIACYGKCTQGSDQVSNQNWGIPMQPHPCHSIPSPAHPVHLISMIMKHWKLGFCYDFSDTNTHHMIWNISTFCIYICIIYIYMCVYVCI